MNRRISLKKSNIYIKVLFLLIAANLRMFYLVDNTSFSIMGIGIEDISFIGAFLFTVLVFIKYHDINFSSFRYRYYLLFILVLSVTTCIAAYKQYSQPFMLTFRTQRHWIVWMLMYFAVKQLIEVKRIKVEQLKNMLIFLLIVYLIIAYLAFALQNSFTFTYSTMGERNGVSRFYFEDCYVILIFSFLIYESLTRFNKKNGLLVLAIFGFLIFVTQMRMITFVAITSLMLCVLIQRQDKYKKTSSILIVLLLVIVFFNTSLGQATLDAILGNSDPSTAWRKLGREFMINKCSNSPFLGCGFINTQWSRAVKEGGVSLKYYAVDNGVFGILFQYGVLGISWMTILLLKCLKDASFIFKNTGNYSFLLYLFINIFGLVTLIPYCFDGNFAFELFLIFLEVELQNVHKFYKGGK